MVSFKHLKKYKFTEHQHTRYHSFFYSAVSVLFFAVLLILYSHEGSSELKKCRVKLSDGTGRELSIDVEIADTEKNRQKGLMYRMSLPDNSGMLFVFEKDRRLSFWMKNTYIPLDIAFIDSHGVITDILQMQPLDTSVFYNSSTEVRYALEVNQWWFQKHGIKPGSKIGLHGCIGK